MESLESWIESQYILDGKKGAFDVRVQLGEVSDELALSTAQMLLKADSYTIVSKCAYPDNNLSDADRDENEQLIQEDEAKRRVYKDKVIYTFSIPQVENGIVSTDPNLCDTISTIAQNETEALQKIQSHLPDGINISQVLLKTVFVVPQDFSLPLYSLIGRRYVKNEMPYGDIVPGGAPSNTAATHDFKIEFIKAMRESQAIEDAQKIVVADEYIPVLVESEPYNFIGKGHYPSRSSMEIMFSNMI
ncbi:MAG: hypothetical protein QG568_200 [Patescibacteria group bacterium]|nr:hypothetical protein [Patescibacteria group bacterium]